MLRINSLLKTLSFASLLFSFSYADTGFGVSDVGTLSSKTSGSISGYVLHDETPLPNTVVQRQELINNNWQTVSNTTSDENAFYSFPDLENGKYRISTRYNPNFPELIWILLKTINIQSGENIIYNSLKGYTVNTYYPDNKMSVSNPVDFTWEKKDAEKKYGISIIREDYPFDEIYEVVTLNSYTVNLNPGNYKWRVLWASSTLEEVFSHYLGSSFHFNFKVDVPQLYFQGNLSSNTNWSGEVHLTGDVTVDQGIVLNIEPGTIVYIDDIDALNEGTSDYQKRVISLNVNGTLIAEGTVDNPIKFIPESEFNNADRAFWHGIVLNNSSISSSFRYCYLSCPNLGVDIKTSSPKIKYCTLNKAYTGINISGSQSVPIIEQNNFHSCNICIGLNGDVLTPNVHYNNFYTVPLSITFGNYAVWVDGNNSGQDLDFKSNYWGIPSSSMPARIWSSGTNIIWDPALNESTGSISWSADLVDWYTPPGWPFGKQSFAKTYTDVDSILWLQMNNCLGPADGSYFSLGYGGYLTFDLGLNNSIVDSTGDDFIIYESVCSDSQDTKIEQEAALVLLGNSKDGPWELAAEITGSSGIDIDALPQDSYRYIKILDVSIGDSSISDQGFDLDAIQIKNNYIATSIQKEKKSRFVKSYSLNQNYPNPFNPTTTISFELFKTDNIVVDIFSIEGRHLKTIFEGRKKIGLHEIKFNADGLSSGVYLYRLTVEGYSETKKMILLR